MGVGCAAMTKSCEGSKAKKDLTCRSLVPCCCCRTPPVGKSPRKMLFDCLDPKAVPLVTLCRGLFAALGWQSETGPRYLPVQFPASSAHGTISPNRIDDQSSQNSGEIRPQRYSRSQTLADMRNREPHLVDWTMATGTINGEMCNTFRAIQKCRFTAAAGGWNGLVLQRHLAFAPCHAMDPAQGRPVVLRMVSDTIVSISPCPDFSHTEAGPR